MKAWILFLLPWTVFAESSHLESALSGRQTFSGSRQAPIDACSVLRFPTLPAPAPAAPAPGPIPPVFPPPRTPKTLCPASCPEPSQPRKYLACSVQVTWSDLFHIESRVAFSECEVQKFGCDYVRQRFGDAPEAIDKSQCFDLPTEKKNACDLTPASKDPACRGTLGGPLTYYYDNRLNECTAYQNLGSCDASGPFATLNDCEKAFRENKCQ